MKLRRNNNLDWTEEELDELGHNLKTAVLAANKKEFHYNCKECSDEYIRYRPKQLFCSEQCRNKWHYNLRKSQLKSYREQLK